MIPSLPEMTQYIKENAPCTCLECGRVTYGRADKKFCSESCKNKWHNRQTSQSRQLRNRILTALNRNYRVLDEALASGQLSVDRALLESRGFRPAFVTGCTRVRYGHDILRCFDISYSQTASKIFKLRKDQAG